MTADGSGFPFRPSLPQGPRALGRDVVEHWAIPLDGPLAIATAARGTLSDAERDRADRFYFEADRRRYMIAHAALRLLLGAYTGTRPERLSFAEADRRKPVLASPASDLHFNLTHSGGLAVLAVTRDAALGVDVERLRPLAERDLVAKRSFSCSEYARLQDLAPDARDLGFLLGWTRKEACVKALGDGLDASLRFDVTLAPGEAAQVVALDGSSAAARGWSLHYFAPAAGYVGATAIGAHPAHVVGWTFNTAALGALAVAAGA